MPLNRDLLAQPFRPDYCPPWTCSVCEVGTFAMHPKSFQKETSDFSRQIYEFTSEPTSIRGTFSCFAKCANAECRELAVISGHWETFEGSDEQGRLSYGEEFFVQWVFPPPMLFPIPVDCPKVVRTPLFRAFQFYWCDECAALNALRSTIESLLTHKRVSRYSQLKGRRRLRGLHDRIEEFKQKHPKVGEVILAAKWLGNAGSHDTEASRGQVQDAMDLVDYSINGIYGTSAKRIEGMAKKINRRAIRK